MKEPVNLLSQCEAGAAAGPERREAFKGEGVIINLIVDYLFTTMVLAKN